MALNRKSGLSTELKRSVANQPLWGIRVVPVFLGFFLLASTAPAQDGERGGEGFRGRGGQDRESEAGQSWDPEPFLRRLDANGNGTLEASEMSGRTARFISGLGMDPSQPVAISDAIDRFKNGGQVETAAKTEEVQSSKRTIIRRVPGFDLPAKTEGTVGGFGVQPSFNSPAEVEKEYGEGIAGQVERALRRYDRNQNGVLEPEEIAAGQWGNPSAAESDLNSDGILTRYELAERYKAREYAASRNEESNDRDRASSDESGEGRRRRSRDEEGSSGRDDSTRSGRGSDGEAGRDSGSRPDDRGSSGGSAASATPARESEAPVASASEGERMRAYADQLVKQYDKDGDGRLSTEEMGKMRRVPKNADPDGDGFSTAGELLDALKSGETSSSSSLAPTRSSGSSRESRRSERSSSESGSDSSSERRGSSRTFSFNANDANRDGQVQMHEFATEWTDEVLEEFRKLDRNNDGIITESEYSSRDR